MKTVTEEELSKVSGCFRDKAFTSEQSRGRKCFDRNRDFDLRSTHWMNPYRIDSDKIVESKAYRRLENKTQVFPSPSNLHVRTRGSHSREVAKNVEKIASRLGLNVDLCIAIGDGHDIGHAPFGHEGERVISNLATKQYGRKVNFRHEIFGVIVAEKIERKGEGLNLTYEVLQGIRHHSRGMNGLEADPSLPFEYSVAMIADKLSFTFSDLNDLSRYQLRAAKYIPSFVAEFGGLQRERMANCIDAIILESAEKGLPSFTDSYLARLFEDLRHWLFDNVYSKMNHAFHEDALTNLYEFFANDCEYTKDCDPCLILALLTDREVIELSTDLMTMPHIGKETLQKYDFWELIPTLEGKIIDLETPDLSWAN